MNVFCPGVGLSRTRKRSSYTGPAGELHVLTSKGDLRTRNRGTASHCRSFIRSWMSTVRFIPLGNAFYNT